MNLYPVFVLLTLLINFIFPLKLFSQQLIQPSRYWVNEINIQGNRRFSDYTLKRLLYLRPGILRPGVEFNIRALKKDNINIKNFYLSKGFLNVVVRDSFTVRQNREVAIYFFIQEGIQYHLEEILIQGNTIVSSAKLRRMFDLKKGDIYNPNLISEGLNRVSMYYLNHGKPLVKLDKKVEVEGDRITYKILINEGPTLNFGKVTVAGVKNVKPWVVLREVVIKEGEVYREEKVDLTRRRVWETGLFSYVDVHPSRIDTINRVVDFVISVRELDMKYIATEIGFGQDRGVSAGSEPYTSIDLSGEWLHRNLFHTGRRLGIKITTSLNLTNILTRPNTDAEIIWTEPWLFPFHSLTSFRLFISNRKQQEAEQTSYGIETYVLYRPDEDLYVQGGLEYRGIRYTQLITVPSEQDLERVINFSIRNDTRGNILYPYNGYLFTADIKVVPGILRNRRRYYKIELGYSRYQNLIGKIVFARRVKLGWMDGIRKEDRTPFYEKFYLGGGTSLRGWPERQFRTTAQGNPLGTDIKFLINGELRFPLIWKFGGEVFIDGGNLPDNISDLLNGKILWDAGAGITFATPLGPVRLDYAYKLNPIEESIQRWQIQLNVLYAF